MIRQIELSKQGPNKGKYVALVDGRDYRYLSKHRWCAMPTKATVYAVRFIGKKCITMHSVIMKTTGNDRKIVVDHIDGNGLNNTRSNLRLATYSQNFMNGKPRKGKRFIGVVKRKSYFTVSIPYPNGKKHIGKYKTEIEAAIAYNTEIVKIRGEFARLNVIPE